MNTPLPLFKFTVRVLRSSKVTQVLLLGLLFLLLIHGQPLFQVAGIYLLFLFLALNHLHLSLDHQFLIILMVFSSFSLSMLNMDLSVCLLLFTWSTAVVILSLINLW